MFNDNVVIVSEATAEDAAVIELEQALNEIKSLDCSVDKYTRERNKKIAEIIDSSKFGGKNEVCERIAKFMGRSARTVFRYASEGRLTDEEYEELKASQEELANKFQKVKPQPAEEAAPTTSTFRASDPHMSLDGAFESDGELQATAVDSFFAGTTQSQSSIGDYDGVEDDDDVAPINRSADADRTLEALGYESFGHFLSEFNTLRDKVDAMPKLARSDYDLLADTITRAVEELEIPLKTAGKLQNIIDAIKGLVA